jgi:hypothetical protein
MNTHKLSVGMTKFMMEGWFMIKLGGLCCLLHRKIEEEEETGEGEKMVAR